MADSPISAPRSEPYAQSQLVQALLGSSDPVHQLRGYGRAAVNNVGRQQYRDDLVASNELAAVLAQQGMLNDNFQTLAKEAPDLADRGMSIPFMSSPLAQGAFNPETFGQVMNADMRGAAETTTNIFKDITGGMRDSAEAGMMLDPGALAALLQQGGMPEGQFAQYMTPSARVAASRAASSSNGSGVEATLMRDSFGDTWKFSGSPEAIRQHIEGSSTDSGDRAQEYKRATDTITNEFVPKGWTMTSDRSTDAGGRIKIRIVHPNRPEGIYIHFDKNGSAVGQSPVQE